MPEDASDDGTETRDGRHGDTDPVSDGTTYGTRSEPDDGIDRTDTERIPIDLSKFSTGQEVDEQPEDDSDDGYAPEPSSAPIEAGDPALEHALFVLLGAIAMILVVVRMLALPF